MTCLTNTGAKRRALGDLINTAKSNRPVVGLTPARKRLKMGSTNTPAKQQQAAPQRWTVHKLSRRRELLPVEWIGFTLLIQ